MQHVVVAGSTGLIGKRLVALLSLRSDVQVTALVRKAGRTLKATNVIERVFDYKADYAAIGTSMIPCDVLLCAIGTTMSQAGSKEAFLAVDRDIPLALIARQRALGKGVFGLVSSTGAGSPRGFYLETKAAVERGIEASGIPSVIVRPSFLLGDREHFRLGEKLALFTIAPLLKGLATATGRRVASLAALEPIADDKVAAMLIAHTIDSKPTGTIILEGAALTQG